MSYKIVTVANRVPTEPYYTFREFFKSLNGEVPLILGTQPGEYGGLGSKPRLLYKAIKEGKIKEKHIIFCDCFDLVFAVTPQKLFEHFIEFGVPFVISAEKNCFPGDTKDEYDKLDEFGLTAYNYVNSGMIVAETAALLAVLDSMDALNIPDDYWDEKQGCRVNPNDQLYYQKEFLKQPVRMELDRYQILCNTLHQVGRDELRFEPPRRIYNKETHEYPCSFHFNGGAKTGGLREPILKKLNLMK